MFDKRMGELESIKQSIIDAVRANILDLLPVGTVLWFKQTPTINGQPLTNWVICEELIGRYPLGTSDASEAGDTVEAGLPNITGDIAYAAIDTSQFTPKPDSALTLAETGSNHFAVDYEDERYAFGHFSFNASRSNSTYGKSTTVTPASMKLLPYIKIA